MNKKVQRRINFRISASLFDSLLVTSRSTGLTKTKILKNWARSTSTLKHYPIHIAKKEKAFNFLISEDDFAFIKDAAFKHNLSVSSYLCSIVFTNIQKCDNRLLESVPANLQALWTSGKYKTLIHSVNNLSVCNLSTEDLINTIKASVELGYNSHTDLVSALRDRIGRANNVKLEMLEKFVNIRLLVRDRKPYNALRELSRLEQFPHEHLAPIQGYVYLFYARVYSSLGDSRSTSQYMKRAFEYAKFTKDVLLKIETYFCLVKYYVFLANFENAAIVLDRIQSILIKHPHAFYQTCLAHEKSMLAYEIGNHAASHTQLNNFFFHYKEIDNKNYTQFSFENLALINYCESKYDSSLNFLHKSISLEKQIKPNVAFSDSQVIENLHLARFDLDSAVKNLKEIKESISPVKTYFIDLYANSLMYLLGEEKARKEGKINLKRMAEEGTYPIARKAAEKTLLTKSFQFVR